VVVKHDWWTTWSSTGPIELVWVAHEGSERSLNRLLEDTYNPNELLVTNRVARSLG
jgi:hypothetical protein